MNDDPVIEMPPIREEDLQLLQFRQFLTEEIARVFGGSPGAAESPTAREAKFLAALADGALRHLQNRRK